MASMRFSVKNGDSQLREELKNVSFEGWIDTACTTGWKVMRQLTLWGVKHSTSGVVELDQSHPEKKEPCGPLQGTISIPSLASHVPMTLRYELVQGLHCTRLKLCKIFCPFEEISMQKAITATTAFSIRSMRGQEREPCVTAEDLGCFVNFFAVPSDCIESVMSMFTKPLATFISFQRGERPL